MLFPTQAILGTHSVLSRPNKSSWLFVQVNQYLLSRTELICSLSFDNQLVSPRMRDSGPVGLVLCPSVSLLPLLVFTHCVLSGRSDDKEPHAPAERPQQGSPGMRQWDMKSQKARNGSQVLERPGGEAGSRTKRSRQGSNLGSFTP